MTRPWMLFPAAAFLLAAHCFADQRSDEDGFRPAAIAVEGVPPIPQELRERLRRYQHVRRAVFAGWSPDGRGVLIATRFGETTQLHRVYEPGGRREQATFFDEPVQGRFLPENPIVLLASLSAGGDENFQIYRIETAPHRAMLLTDGRSRNLLGSVRRDGGALVYASNARNGRDMDLYVAGTQDPPSPRRIFQVDGETWSVADWSTDGRTLLLARYVSINESYPALLDVESGRRTDIPIPGGEKAAFGAMAFAPDGRFAYVASDAQSEFRRLARVDLENFGFNWVASSIPWDVTDIQVDPTTGRTAFLVNQNGAGSLYLLEDGGPRKLDLPMAVVSGLEFSPNGKSLGMTLSPPDAPSEAYSVDLASGRLERWTYSELGGLDPGRFVKPELVSFPSFDDRRIPAYYFRPASAAPETPAPVLIHIHGGPEGQYRPLFSEFDQFLLAELGVAVLHPNVRGSSGYGKTYVALDNAERREDSVRDIGAALDWIAARPELDPSRVAVYGASYGGYMVLASLSRFPDRIRAGVDVVGIASFQTFLETTSPYRRDLRRAEYGDERDPKMQEFFARIDPIHNVDKIRSALLVAHGRNDPRVPFSQAEAIAAAVRASGRDVWTVYADNEGHGFAKKANRDYLNAVVVLFLEKQLK